ncbi:MAG: hypothetical protein FJ220_02685 [Kiritimatiellaceae bacterium]|nr:hypothetical protein [Kiritimatiellaceae bacterium]
MAVEISCSHCGAAAFLKREPVYQGLKKTGEELSCSACGYVFPSEDQVPFQARAEAPKLFTAEDRSPQVKVFNEGENKRICRYCANYVVNPFVQFCACHKKEVQATDTCSRFSAAKDRSASSRKDNAGPLF